MEQREGGGGEKLPHIASSLPPKRPLSSSAPPFVPSGSRTAALLLASLFLLFSPQVTSGSGPVLRRQRGGGESKERSPRIKTPSPRRATMEEDDHGKRVSSVGSASSGGARARGDGMDVRVRAGATMHAGISEPG